MKNLNKAPIVQNLNDLIVEYLQNNNIQDTLDNKVNQLEKDLMARTNVAQFNDKYYTLEQVEDILKSDYVDLLKINTFNTQINRGVSIYQTFKREGTSLQQSALLVQKLLSEGYEVVPLEEKRHQQHHNNFTMRKIEASREDVYNQVKLIVEVYKKLLADKLISEGLDHSNALEWAREEQAKQKAALKAYEAAKALKQINPLLKHKQMADILRICPVISALNAGEKHYAYDDLLAISGYSKEKLTSILETEGYINKKITLEDGSRGFRWFRI